MSEVATRVHLDPNGEDLTVEQIQDVEPILEWNKWSRAEEQKSDWGRHVARIPNVIYVQWYDEAVRKGNTSLRMYSPEFDEIVQQKLKDPDWAYLRTDYVASLLGFGS